MNSRWLPLVFFLLLAAGCSPGSPAGYRGNLPPPAAEAGYESAIIGGEAPGRDPFARGEAFSLWAGQTDLVIAVGRNPFAPSADAGTKPEPGPETDEPGVSQPAVPDGVNLTGRVNVLLKLLDRCWLEVLVDNELVLRTNVSVSTVLEYAAQGEVALRQVGRDYAVEVHVNGHNLGRLSDLVLKMSGGVYEEKEAGVRISLERRYAGGVLAGLRFRPLE